METLCTLAGAALLLWVILEVYQTILHSRGRTGFISETLNRLTWRSVRAIAFRMSRHHRHVTLNYVGPLLLPALILILVLMMIVGFALIYYPRFPGSFSLDDAVSNTANWENALYFSGVSLLTIGYGDITPLTPMVRTVALIEGASGFALISLAVTYLLTVYRALERKREIGLAFYHQADEGADVSDLICHHFVNGKFVGFEDALRQAVQDMHEMNESHFEHPVIHYFHPREVYRNFPRTLFLTLETCAVVRSCIDGETYPETRDSPEIRTLETSARYVLKNVITHIGLRDKLQYRIESPEQENERWFKRWKHTMEQLAKAGIVLRSDTAQSYDEYRTRRNDWEAALYQFSNYLGYDWNEISGDYDLKDAEDAGVKELGTDAENPAHVSVSSAK